MESSTQVSMPWPRTWLPRPIRLMICVLMPLYVAWKVRLQRMPYLQSGKKDGTRFGMTCGARRHGHTGTGLTQRTSAVYAICWCESNASSYSRTGPRTYIVKPKRLCRHSVKLRKLQRRTWPTDSQSGCQSAETSSSSLAVIESRTHTSVKVWLSRPRTARTVKSGLEAKDMSLRTPSWYFSFLRQMMTKTQWLNN